MFRSSGSQRQRCPLRKLVKANKGNFLALLQFVMEAGEKVLATHVSKAAKNARYNSS